MVAPFGVAFKFHANRDQIYVETIVVIFGDESGRDLNCFWLESGHKFRHNRLRLEIGGSLLCAILTTRTQHLLDEGADSE